MAMVTSPLSVSLQPQAKAEYAKATGSLKAILSSLAKLGAQIGPKLSFSARREAQSAAAPIGNEATTPHSHLKQSRAALLHN